ncbi:MAG: hypothetical protein WB699_16575 [Bacteroidota bacterium]
MTVQSPTRYAVTLEQGHGLGSPWIVRVYHKWLFGKRLVSSDWFLDQKQAEQFVRDATKGLQSDNGTELLKTRKPGWIFRRPSH